MSESFVCGVCGDTHSGLPTDHAYKLPDEVWAIPEQERSNKAKFTTDLCQSGGRNFIRCVLKVPFIETSGYFGWGVWVEVESSTFERYLSFYESDGSTEPPYAGKLANSLPAYDESAGAKVFIQFGPGSERPLVCVPAEDASRLATEQRNGIDSVRYHEILTLFGN